jgi:hypothetical protein
VNREERGSRRIRHIRRIFPIKPPYARVYALKQENVSNASDVSDTFLFMALKGYRYRQRQVRRLSNSWNTYERYLTMATFSRIYLPYVLLVMEDGCVVPLNRDYKPLGQLGDMMPGVAHRTKVRIKGLTPAVAERIGLRAGGKFLYLYDDASTPHTSAANWQRYEAILAKLMKMEIADADGGRLPGRAGRPVKVMRPSENLSEHK